MNLETSSLDIDLSNVEQLPSGGINTGSEDISLDGLIDLEVGNKIEFNNEELLEPWVEDPAKTNTTIPQVEEPMSHFIEDRYEDELLFVSLEI